MNEGGGNIVNDLSGNGNTLNAINSPSWIGGKFGSSLKFVATSSQVIRGTAPLVSYPRTLVVWVNVGTHVAYGRIFAYVDGDGNASTIAVANQSGEIICAGENTSQTGKVFTYNIWHQIVAVYISEPVVTVYMDGKLAVNGSQASPLAQGNIPTGSMSIGGRWDASYMNAVVDHAMIYNRDLSANDIMNLYKNPFRMFEVDL